MLKRDAGLDAARGLAMGLMIVVNNAGDWSHVYAPLKHAAWNGFTLADLVFPLFLWVSGAAAAWSLASLRDQRAQGAVEGAGAAKALRRFAVLFGIGLCLNAIPAFDLAGLRIPGVLQRIALAALFVWAWARCMPRKADLAGAAALIVVWTLLLVVPEGGLDPVQNLGARLDRAILGREHLYQHAAFDPEGLLSTLGACATALLGLHAGEQIRSSGAREVRGRLALHGCACLALGAAATLVVPLNKPLWTGSYVLVAAGACALVRVALDSLAQLRAWSPVHALLAAMGHNALLLYVGAGLLARLLLAWQVPWQDGTSSARSVLYQTWFAPLGEAHATSLLFAAANLLLWCPLLVWLHRRGWRWSA